MTLRQGQAIDWTQVQRFQQNYPPQNRSYPNAANTILLSHGVGTRTLTKALDSVGISRLMLADSLAENPYAKVDGSGNQERLSANSMTAINLQPVLDFLVQLENNNDRAWFEQHRDAYEGAKAQFEQLVDQVIAEFRAIEDLGNITAKDCVMRLYRDVRFAKDKSPYRTHFAAVIAAGGKKSSRMPYYLHLAPHDQSFIAGGLYMPTSAQLPLSRNIDHNAKPFKTLINHQTFKPLFGELSGEKLKTAPQGYARDHPEIALLRLKQVTATHPLADEAVLAATFPAQIMEVLLG